MHWFSHENDLRNDSRMRAIEKKLGEAGYARAIKLWEVVAKHGGNADKFVPVLDLNSACTDMDWLAEELRITAEELQKTLDIFAAVEWIDSKAWRKKIIYIPQMEKHLDDWTKRLQRVKKLQRDSGVTPEQLRSESGATLEQLRLKSKSKRVEKEAEAEPQRKEKAAAAAAAPFQENPKPDPKSQEVHPFWKDIDIRPLGTPAFCRAMERFYDEYPELPVSGRMEEGIQFCQSGNIPVPPPIFEAKRKVESREFDEDVGPYLNEEVARVAGPRGVPEELMR